MKRIVVVAFAAAALVAAAGCGEDKQPEPVQIKGSLMKRDGQQGDAGMQNKDKGATKGGK